MLGVLAQISSEKESVESLMQAVETCDRLYGEIQTLQQVVDDLEYKFGMGGAGVKSMEEMQRELHSAQDARYESLNEFCIYSFKKNLLMLLLLWFLTVLI